MGKSAFLEAFKAHFGGRGVSAREIVISRTSVPNERRALQEAADRLASESYFTPATLIFAFLPNHTQMATITPKPTL